MITIEEIWRGGHADEEVSVDCLIAAAAVGVGAAPATATIEDFPMPDPRVAHWPS